MESAGVTHSPALARPSLLTADTDFPQFLAASVRLWERDICSKKSKS